MRKDKSAKAQRHEGAKWNVSSFLSCIRAFGRSRHFIINITKFMLYVFLLLWPIAGIAQAQKLSATVFDKKNQEPVAGVHVYLDGSSLYDVTNANGKFEIKAPSMLALPLVISHISYQTKVISNPFTSLPDTIFVDEKENLLGEITVQAGKYSRRQLLNAFRTEFLGSSTGAKSCIIENENKIDLWYNSQTNTLFASCDEPVMIHNRFLGYRIYVRLNKFEMEYTSRKFGVGQPVVFFECTSYFMDLAPSNKNITNRREFILEGSSRHFLYALANSSLDAFGYNLYLENEKFPTPFLECFTVTDSLGLKNVLIDNRLRPKDIPVYMGLPYFGRIIVKRAFQQTELIFYTDNFLVNEWGYLNGTGDILFVGYMGALRVGDMLPLDYEIVLPKQPEKGEILF